MRLEAWQEVRPKDAVNTTTGTNVIFIATKEMKMQIARR